MILMSLLLVLSIERLVAKTSRWHGEFYVRAYRDWLEQKGLLSESTKELALWFYMLAPALLVAAVEVWLLGSALTFVLQTLVLFIAIGCPALRATYKCFLNAADRGDLQACSMYTDELGHCENQGDENSARGQGRSFGQHLTWLNYQHYAAVMLWFVAFGAPGVIFYVVSRSTADSLCAAKHPLATSARHLMYALDFIPVRITALGLLFMGHFSRALPEWVKHVLSPETSAYDVLTSVSAKAEMLSEQELEAQTYNASVEPKVLVKLAKRNVMFLLAATSILTLSGFIA
ncbi:beta-lactamase regulator AmpE [Alteromonas sp. KUL49]|uniref:beta-lactamase regulator AmpE n=1 Tax=Alteromonas sp. KUL49 TaxID=2480798 RepID=UPI00102EEC52|nr:beta-lactamase regulator AmpE [Alteromonas sp. KUL49]TAP41564.1 beta-lactamase regulator AmpE [Alteromonas sp. KUL49]GEA10660.1 hypothetical protein KUL49_10350 [Alteromonas sp. KUL49]